MRLHGRYPTLELLDKSRRGSSTVCVGTPWVLARMPADPAPVRSVLVTGATSGIGRATALALAEKGAQLTLLARSAQTLDQVREDCVAAGSPHVAVVPADVADASALTDVITAHQPDAVVHSAAVMSYGAIADTSADVLTTLVRTNVLGAALVARESLRLFAGRGHGRLVLVSSLLGHVPMPLMGAYSMSKAAVSALAEVLQAETRQQPGIHADPRPGARGLLGSRVATRRRGAR